MCVCVFVSLQYSRWVSRPCLVLQGGHALFQMELQSFIGLGEETIHGVRQTLVVLLVHFLPLPSLTIREMTSYFPLDTDAIKCSDAANQSSLPRLLYTASDYISNSRRQGRVLMQRWHWYNRGVYNIVKTHISIHTELFLLNIVHNSTAGKINLPCINYSKSKDSSQSDGLEGEWGQGGQRDMDLVQIHARMHPVNPVKDMCVYVV